MTENIKITCDSCENDITYTANCRGYILCLNVEAQTPSSGIVTLMHVSPPIESRKHFCGLGCLKRWVMKNVTLPEDIK
jgi:hypothetical protein